jgi:hypothetical protein
MINTLWKFYQKYERYFSPVALLTGFVWDNLTLQRVDLWLDNLVLLLYLIIAGAGIAFINAAETGRLKFAKNIAGFMPLALQFAFGGLFSAFVVFFSRSASFITSWPFLIFLGVMLIGNEILRKHYERFVFHAAIFFIAVFSYSILIVPTVLKKLGPEVFILSGLVSLAFMGFIMAGLTWVAPQKIREGRRTVLAVVVGIYAAFHILYFTNIIPPIPLSLKEGGIYHSVRRTDGGFEIQFEPTPWYVLFRDYDIIFHYIPGEAAYAYSSVFAPTKLNTTILHRWSYYDEKSKEWLATDRLSFKIVGGRDGGYRGYTFKTNLIPGKWRVDVITERDQRLGQMSFQIVQTDSLTKLEKKIK